MAIDEFQVKIEKYPFDRQFRQDWDALYHKSLGANHFNRLSWLEAGWLHCAGENDAIRPVRFVDSTGRTRAMCVHMETTVKRPWGATRVWKNLDFNIQRMSPVLAGSTPDMAAALAAIIKTQQTRIDSFEFYKLDPLGGRLQDICKVLDKENLSAQMERFNYQPRIVMEDDWEEFKEKRSGKAWRNLRRQQRRLTEEQGRIEFQRIRSREDFSRIDVGRIFEEINEIFDQSRYNLGSGLDWGSYLRQLQHYYSANVDQNLDKGLDINILRVEGRPIAFDLNLVEGKTVLMLLGAFEEKFSPYSPGSVLFAHWLADSHARGDRIIEYGGYPAAYRANWAGESVTSYHLRHYGQTRKCKFIRPLRRIKTSSPLRLIRRILKKDWEHLPLPGWFYQREDFHVFQLPPVKKAKTRVVNLQLSRLEVEDLPALAECRKMADPKAGMASLRPRWEKGSLCFGAWSGDRLAAYCFAKKGGFVVTDSWDRFDMNLDASAAYGYDTYIHPDFRGTGLFPVLIRFAWDQLASLGTERLYAVVDIDNYASIKARSKIGGRIIETVSYRCLLGVINYRFSGDGITNSRWGVFGRGRFPSQKAK